MDRVRGQIAAKLKRLGIEQPATDFFFSVIEQIPQEASTATVNKQNRCPQEEIMKEEKGSG
jgi:hypothetical protein